VQLINDKGLSAKERDQYFRALDFITGQEKDAAMAELALSGLK